MHFLGQFPKVKIQSNFTFTMASSGDPSTFDFVIDAFPAYTAYGCTKAALSYFTKTMAKELAQYNIRVNAVAPGQVLTDMLSKLTDKAKEEIVRRCAMGRPALPDEIADTILYLSSNKASFITGQIIRVDGGL